MNGDEQGIDLPRPSITTFYRVIKVFLHYLDSGSNLGARTPLFLNALVEFDKHSLTNGLVCKRPVKSFSRKLSSPFLHTLQIVVFRVQSGEPDESPGYGQSVYQGYTRYVVTD